MPRPALRVLAPDGRMAAALREMARAAAVQGWPPLVVTQRAQRALAGELGGREAVARFLGALVRETGRPLLVNTPDPGAPEARSLTGLVAPPGWSRERALGYLGGLKDELAAEFGAVAGRPEGIEPPAPSGPPRRERRSRARATRKGAA